MITQRIQPDAKSERSGVAAVEFAICLPVLMMLFLASLECANMIFLKQTLAVSSYEGIRKAIQFDATNDDTLARCNQILTARNIVNPTITFSPTDISTAATGAQVQVTVSADCAANSLLQLSFFGGDSMSVTSTMVKE